MTNEKTVAKKVQSVIENASLAQAERDNKWLNIGATMQADGEKFAIRVLKLVKSSGMTIFTLVDAKHYAVNVAQRSGLEDAKKAQKKGANALSWLRRELRASGVKVESDARGGANNKKGANGKAPTTNKAAGGKGLPKIIEAIAMVRQAAEADLFEKDRPMFMHLLAMMETAEKTKLSTK